MFTLYHIAFAPARKPYQIGLLFTQKNGDLGVVSVMERSCSRPIVERKWRVTYRIGVHTITDIGIRVGRKSYPVGVV